MDEQLPRVVLIDTVVEETPTVRSIFFHESFPCTPGQFVMVWVPGVDEIPMALSSPCSISVQKVGDATEALFSYQEGDAIGIRGPFGNGFSATGRTLAVAGGIGAAPLLPLAVSGKVDVFLLGARTGDELPFVEVLGGCTALQVATDDGSRGYHGFVTHLMDGVDLEGFDHICVCGPEVMMRAALERLDREGIADRGQFSLHRYMKCGIGICGSCCIDPHGLRVCRDGPVFSGDLLLGTEFGRYGRDASGRKKKV